MEKKEKKELIEHIADTLKEQHLPYKEGAWEHFAQTRLGRKRPAVLWPYIAGVAAMVLVGLSLFLRYDDAGQGLQVVERHDGIDTTKSSHTGQDEPLLVDARSGDSKPDGSSEGHSDHTDTAAPDKERGEELAITRVNQGKRGSVLASADRGIKSANEENLKSMLDAQVEEQVGHEVERGLEATNRELEKERLALAEEVAVLHDEKTENRANREEKKDIMSLFEQDKPMEQDLKVAKDERSSGRKWGFGVAVSPLMTEESVNMGGGFVLAYKLTDKLSVGSGLSLVDLNVATDRVNPNAQFVMEAAPMVDTYMPMNSISAVAGSRELSSVSSNVLGLDIPLDLKYELTKRLYIGAGVSLFTALNESRMNNYTTRLDNSMMVGSQGIGANRAPAIMAVRSSEYASEEPIKNSGYSTFLNFSVGQKVPISSYMGLSVEPFYKLPMGNIANQNMNFNYGGIRIIASF